MIEMVKAIISDLDGTILPCGGEISKEALHAFGMLGERKIVRIIATGRTLFAARRFLPDDFPIDFLVFSSGAGIMHWKDKKIILARHLSILETRQIAAYLWEYNINFMIQQEIPDNHYFYYTDIYPAHSDYKRRIEKFGDFGRLIACPEEIRTAATQFVMILNSQQLPLVEKVKNDLPHYSVIRSTSPLDRCSVWLEVYSRNVNKGTACRILLKQLSIQPAECGGLGNDYNDVDFLDICGKAFLVANAPHRLMPYYKSVSADTEKGFVEFVEQVCKS